MKKKLILKQCFFFTFFLAVGNFGAHAEDFSELNDYISYFEDQGITVNTYTDVDDYIYNMNNDYDSSNDIEDFDNDGDIDFGDMYTGWLSNGATNTSTTSLPDTGFIQTSDPRYNGLPYKVTEDGHYLIDFEYFENGVVDYDLGDTISYDPRTLDDRYNPNESTNSTSCATATCDCDSFYCWDEAQESYDCSNPNSVFYPCEQEDPYLGDCPSGDPCECYGIGCDYSNTSTDTTPYSSGTNSNTTTNYTNTPTYNRNAVVQSLINTIELEPGSYEAEYLVDYAFRDQLELIYSFLKEFKDWQGARNLAQSAAYQFWDDVELDIVKGQLDDFRESHTKQKLILNIIGTLKLNPASYEGDYMLTNVRDDELRVLTEFLNENGSLEAEELAKLAILEFWDDVELSVIEDLFEAFEQNHPDPYKRKNMTPEQETELQQAINNLNETCLGKALLSSLTSVDVMVGELSPGAVAQYKPQINSIVFFEEGVGNSLGEESFHAYQQQLYGTLIDISSSSSGHIGGSNIEFEEKAFTMISGWIEYDKEIDALLEANPYDAVSILPPTVFEENILLSEWARDLVDNHFNSLAPITLTTDELNLWFEALEVFQQYHYEAVGCGAGLYGCPIDYSLNPNAIVDLFNKAKENCNQ